MKVLLGSKNPGKIEGTELAFGCFFKDLEVIGIPVSSDVSDEPVSEDIFNGARNRVNNLIEYAKSAKIDADYYAGVESGIAKIFGKWLIINVAVIKNKMGVLSMGVSSGFPVPDKYVEEIINTDLGKVMDKIFNENDLRSKVGGINYLTHGAITRIDLTKEALVMALTTFVNDDKWID